jgi:hypothetical protein
MLADPLTLKQGAIIVLPVALVEQWRLELIKFANWKDDIVYVHHGPSRFKGIICVIDTFDGSLHG